MRLTDRRGNGRNVRKPRRSCSSRYKGVSKKGSRWYAKIAGRHISTFATEESAARAYDAAAHLEFGEFARLNFPREAA